MAYILDVAFLGTSVGTLELIGVAIIVLTNMLLGLIDYLCAKSKEEKLLSERDRENEEQTSKETEFK